MVDGYHLTPHHTRLRDTVRAFAEAEIRPRVAELEAGRSVARDLSRHIARQGWLGVTIDPTHGGLGLGHLAKTIIIEELSRVCAAMGAMLQASQLGTAKIIHFGSDTQKQTWLPAIAAGDCLPTIAVTEPGSGSHVLGITTTAVRDGDDYLITGTKTFVGNSHIGDLHGVVARTGPGTLGLSAFLVEADRPGVRLTPHEPSMGLHGFSFGEIVFDNCRIPAANRLGVEGDGLDVAYSSSVLYGRPNLAAVALGIHQAVLDTTVTYTTSQHRYGKPLADLPTVKQRIGAMQSRLMVARLAAYHAAHLLDRGLPCDAELVNAKLVNAEQTIDSARTAMEIHAAHGLHPARSPIERYFRDALHIVAPAGTSDIQLLRLAEHALGAARQPWSTRFHSSVSLRRRQRGEVKPTLRAGTTATGFSAC
ncbi:acyl-CoA dehydrogenase family protein [Micromonospora sp. WMMD882]|uniref:acyl-CoA dehydrogenase family protein n=1 Tax=Micromonospora sp. WMMD882 TaxID=3015151 RepID=UPI00248B82F8|nr:acyl-CoA dehydrogenase family protein [Micromonospora sp. WMMD882]WBB78535.1 acyl-CoA dehydrogenase family protein [Micromonospora sp. WMMD882]